MLVSDIKDKLESANFHMDNIEEGSIDTECGGFLYFQRDDDGSIELEVEYTKAYKYLLLSEEEGDNYPRCGESGFNYSDLEVFSISISKESVEISISDPEDEDELKRLDGCLNYFKNPYLWIKKTSELFYKELDELLPTISPILGMYDFIQSGIYLDIEESNEFYIEWVYKYNPRFVFIVHLDIFKHEFYMSPDGFKLIKDIENFEKYFIDHVLSRYHYGDGREIELEFKRFFSEDPKWTKDSPSELLNLRSDVDLLNKKFEKGEKMSLNRKINENIIPDEYKSLLDQYHRLLETDQNP